MNNKEMAPWEECPDVWPTQASYFNWLRGQLRGGAWKRHPVKLKFIRDNRFKAPIGRIVKATGKPKEVWAGRCACCGGTFRQSDLQVDHIHGAGSFQGWHDLEQWVHALLHVNCSMLQFMCKTCHDTKTYAEKHNISFEEAAIEKQVIAWLKDTSVKEQKSLLATFDMPNNNANARRNSYRQLITGESQ